MAHLLGSRTQICWRCRNLLAHFYKTLPHGAENLPRITVPHQITQKLERMKAKNMFEKIKKKKPHYKGPLVIACKRKEYNHYQGQTYSEFNPQHLASHGWKHPKSEGDYFTIQAVQGNPSLMSGSGLQFDSLGIMTELVNGLKDLGITQPTSVQTEAIPAFNEGHNVLCAAETGSGKTLAYMLPMLQRIHRAKTHLYQEPTHNAPLGVIVVPSSELADQIQVVSEKLGLILNLKSRSLCGGRGTGRLLGQRHEHDVDILVATPGILSRLFSSALYQPSRLQMLVLDEVDTLLDDSFSSLTRKLIHQMNLEMSQPEDTTEPAPVVGTQVGLVGATMPRDMENIIGGLIPVDVLHKVTTSHLHRLMPHVPQQFLKIRSSKKPEHLLKFMNKNKKKKIPTIIFCNKTATSVFVSRFLKDNGVGNTLLHGQMSAQERRGRFDKFQEGEENIFVCTDLASRGLDTIRAQHIINYEMPSFMSDYIHRVGRIGRVCSQGNGFALSYVTFKWDVDLLWKIEASARRLTELHNVNANIKRKLVGRQQEKQQQNMADDSVPPALKSILEKI